MSVNPIPKSGVVCGVDGTAHKSDADAPGTQTAPALSIVVVVTERFDDVESLYRKYKAGVLVLNRPTEFIYVLDGDYPDTYSTLRRLRAEGEPIRIIKLAKNFGEATALHVAFEQSSGDAIVTLPAYEQIDASEIRHLIESLDGHDLVFARRWPRRDSIVNRVQSWVFNALQRAITKFPAHDLGCGVRVLRRAVAREVPMYGDQHRFLPLLAHRIGFRVREVNARQSEKDMFRRLYAPGVYLRRLLDLMSVFFLVKFTKKPLRFFGLVGSATLLVGVLATLWLVVERSFFGMPLATRPALVIAALMVVLGIQIIAIGLIGELLIFTHAKEIKEYTIEEIVN
jgi:glycosyltransferase involved in cell wall biosynthesis